MLTIYANVNHEKSVEPMLGHRDGLTLSYSF